MTGPPRLFVHAGIRTPFGRLDGSLRDLSADDLGAAAVREVVLRTGIDPGTLDGVICGNVGQGAHAPNVARVIALRAGIPRSVEAMTVHRNCASGFEAVTTAAQRLEAGRGSRFLVVATESMSQYPLLFRARGKAWFSRLARSRSVWDKLRTIAQWRPSMFAPEIALLRGLEDPVVDLGMGDTAEILAREWDITREEQDAFAARSHERALAAREHLRGETFDIAHANGVLRDDEGVRTDSTIERLARLRTAFDREFGSVTAGNSSQITDGAVALIVGGEDAFPEHAGDPLGYVDDYAYAGCDPERMGLGPVHALHALYPKSALPEFDVVEINEAFAAQVLACQKALKYPGYARDVLGRPAPLGSFPEESLNPNGGAIALGHPVGATGARLVLTALRELTRRGGARALATLCVGGGQGAAVTLRR